MDHLNDHWSRLNRCVSFLPVSIFHMDHLNDQCRCLSAGSKCFVFVFTFSLQLFFTAFLNIFCIISIAVAVSFIIIITDVLFVYILLT